LIVLSLVVGAAASIHAEEEKPKLPEGVPQVAPQVVEYIRFTNVVNTIDCGNLGGVGKWGTYESPEATIELESTTGIRVDYEIGPDLQTADKMHSMNTVFRFAVQGLGEFDGQKFESEPFAQNDYSGFFDRDQESKEGTILFAPTTPAEPEMPFTPDPKKKLKVHVAVQRSGLNDRAGQYSTEVVLRWYKF
jgi:hypothetical protein